METTIRRVALPGSTAIITMGLTSQNSVRDYSANEVVSFVSEFGLTGGISATFTPVHITWKGKGEEGVVITMNFKHDHRDDVLRLAEALCRQYDQEVITVELLRHGVSAEIWLVEAKKPRPDKA